MDTPPAVLEEVIPTLEVVFTSSLKMILLRPDSPTGGGVTSAMGLDLLGILRPDYALEADFMITVAVEITNLCKMSA